MTPSTFPTVSGGDASLGDSTWQATSLYPASWHQSCWDTRPSLGVRVLSHVSYAWACVAEWALRWPPAMFLHPEHWPTAWMHAILLSLPNCASLILRLPFQRCVITYAADQMLVQQLFEGNVLNALYMKFCLALCFWYPSGITVTSFYSFALPHEVIWFYVASLTKAVISSIPLLLEAFWDRQRMTT